MGTTTTTTTTTTIYTYLRHIFCGLGAPLDVIVPHLEQAMGPLGMLKKGQFGRVELVADRVIHLGPDNPRVLLRTVDARQLLHHHCVHSLRIQRTNHLGEIVPRTDSHLGVDMVGVDMVGVGVVGVDMVGVGVNLGVVCVYDRIRVKGLGRFSPRE